MQTVKTAIVVVLLATVVYSAWVALTAPPADLPPELAHIVEGDGSDTFNIDDIDIGISDGESMEDFAPPPILSGDPNDPNSIHSDMGSTSDPSASPSLPPPLSPSTTVAGASDYAPPTMSAGASSGSPAGNPAASARLSDSNASSPPPTNFGYEIPARQTPADTAKAGSNTAAADTPPSIQDDPGGFQLPDSYDLGASEPATANIGDTVADATSSSVDSSSESKSANQTALANAIATADRQQQQDQLREALTTLSLFYNTPSLGAEERAALLSRLDYLAGEVVYSKRHLLEQPYRVSAGETLESIAQSLNVPWQLLATINQVTDPAKVVPGQELKVVRGPFRAEVNLARSELTLMLGELYAGRFPMTVGKDPTPKAGDYKIQDKQNARTYYALGGANIPAGDDRNPYGDVWLDLGNSMCIHGTGRSVSSTDMGCIRLSPSDAKDVYSILSKGSSVTVLR